MASMVLLFPAALLSPFANPISASAGGGVRLTAWNNTASSGTPIYSEADSAPLTKTWPRHEGVLSSEWLGSITPSDSAAYLFNCTFVGGYGLAWVDGQVLCTHSMPLYRGDGAPNEGSIPLERGKRYAVRMMFMKNSTHTMDVSAEMHWTKFTTRWENYSETGPEPIPTSVLSPTSPSAAHAKLMALQRKQYSRTAGWGSWYPHNLLCVTRLPDGAQLRFGLCQISTGACELISIDSAQSVRLGVHAADGSYAQLNHWFAGKVWDGGVNVSIAWGTSVVPAQPESDLDALAELRLTIGGARCSNCSNYAIVLEPGFSPIWGRTGTVSVSDQASEMKIAPSGSLPPSTLKVSSGKQLSVEQRASLMGAMTSRDDSMENKGPRLAFAVELGAKHSVVVSSITESTAATVSALERAAAAEHALYTNYGTPVLAELKEAVQSSVMWLTVFTPFAAGLMLTLSRGSMGGGNSQCDWDNFFAAMMQASDAKGRDLGLVTYAQELGSKTVGGFVPNGANAAQKDNDRTEPIVGAKVLLEILQRFGIDQTRWLVEWSFRQLYGWHGWAWANRRLQPYGLIAAGSSPVPPFTRAPDCHSNLMQCARWETGMDNSPMYDGPDISSDNKSGPIFFNTTSHLMELMDVGMTANLASDMAALATIGEVWCNATRSPAMLDDGAVADDAKSSTTEGSDTPSSCGAEEWEMIATLRSRVAQLSEQMQAHLWDDELGAFVNKMPADAYNLSSDTFYKRVSPTSFYPLMAGMATAEQAERTVTDHLLNASRFCLVPEESWPPAPAPAAPGQLLLQSWQMPHAGDRNICAGAADCDKLRRAGGHLQQNESIVWSQAAPGRTPLYRFRLNNTQDSSPQSRYRGGQSQTVVGRIGDFPTGKRVTSSPLFWASTKPPSQQPGAWPLKLWKQISKAGGGGVHPVYRISGGPASDQELSNGWEAIATLGYALPLPGACYWGLPSISFDDPAFGSPGGFPYWRGNAWAPLAMLNYWGLRDPAYANVSAVQVARKGLANSYARMWMETAWRPSHTVCENYCVHAAGGCCGDTFYHWGALAGFMSILEAGK